MIRVTLTPDAEKMAEVRESLASVPRGLDRAFSGAINKTLPKVRTKLVADVNGHIFLKPAEIRKAMKIRKASPRSLSGSIDISKVRTKAVQFPYAATAAGVQVQFGPDRPPQIFRHAFVAKMPSGHVGIFERQLGLTHRESRVNSKGEPYSTQLPIKELPGVSVEGVVQNAPDLLAKNIEAADVELNKQLDSQVDRLLNRKKVEAE